MHLQQKTLVDLAGFLRPHACASLSVRSYPLRLTDSRHKGRQYRSYYRIHNSKLIKHN